MRNLHLLTFFLMLSSAHADDYIFKSKIDNFTINLSNDDATYKGNSVPLEPFNFVKKIFDIEFEDDCPTKLSHPDLIITQKGTNNKIRQIYMEKHIISDGKHCGEIDSDALFQLPMHHSWLTENSTMSIKLNDAFTILKDNKVIVDFIKSSGRWQNKDPQFFTNWVFFENFIESLNKFKVDFRVHPAAAKSLSTFELIQGKNKYTFARINNKTWAVQIPGQKWLVASGQFGLFEDMNPRIWISPNEKILKIISDPTANENSRITSLRALAATWGPDIKNLSQEILLREGDNIEVKKEIVSILRRKPTEENFKFLVEALSVNHDVDLQTQLCKTLRILDPKGPVITDDDSAAEVKNKIEHWQKWAKTLKSN